MPRSDPGTHFVWEVVWVGLFLAVIGPLLAGFVAASRSARYFFGPVAENAVFWLGVAVWFYLTVTR